MAESHPNFTTNQNIILYNEVDGVCPMPMCCEELMYEKVKSKQKNYEIAHIYPLNPKPEELLLLKKEQKLNDDPNHLDNLICLCVGCHTKFDKPRTLEGYQEMFKLKKSISLKNKERSSWKNSELTIEIYSILDFLASNDNLSEDISIIEYEPKTIDAKTNETITKLIKRKIKNNVEEYYHVIKTKFKEIDSVKPLTTEILSSQIKSYFLKMSQQYSNQADIFNALVEWIQTKTSQPSREASEIIVSYFIQNCEVF